MIFFIYIVDLAIIILMAAWEAQLLTPGDSNHIPKIIELLCFGILVILFYMEGRLKNSNFIDLLLCLFIFPLLYLAFFDYALNHFRGLDLNYKLCCDPVIKFLSLIVSVFVMIYYYVQKQKRV